jgi:hypothetical protein
MYTLLLATLLTLASDPPATIPTTLVQVRPLSNIARSILDEGVRRSATIEDLIEQLRQYHVIVYVEVRAEYMHDRGATSVLSATDDWRMLRVSLSDRIDPGTRLVILGHELYHALEIARDASVRDAASFKTYFNRIGFPLGENSFETEAAMAIEARVRAELSRSGRSRPQK